MKKKELITQKELVEMKTQRVAEIEECRSRYDRTKKKIECENTKTLTNLEPFIFEDLETALKVMTSLSILVDKYGEFSRRDYLEILNKPWDESDEKLVWYSIDDFDILTKHIGPVNPWIEGFQIVPSEPSVVIPRKYKGV